MKKFFIKDSEQEIKVGDYIRIDEVGETSSSTFIGNLTASVLRDLYKKGIIEEREVKVQINGISLDTVINRIKAEQELLFSDYQSLEIFKEDYPVAYRSFIIKYIYDVCHIEALKDGYVLSAITGNIYPLREVRGSVDQHQDFGIFKTEEDAENAKSILVELGAEFK